MIHQFLEMGWYNRYSTQGTLILTSTITSTTSQIIALVYWSLNNFSVHVEKPLLPSLLVKSVLYYHWMLNLLFKFHIILSHILLLSLPIIILPQLLQLRSICQFSPMKIQIWLLPKSFFSCDTKVLVTETYITSSIFFAMFIHSPLPSLQDMKNVKYLNVRHVNMWRLTDIQEKEELCPLCCKRGN